MPSGLSIGPYDGFFLAAQNEFVPSLPSPFSKSALGGLDFSTKSSQRYLSTKRQEEDAKLQPSDWHVRYQGQIFLIYSTSITFILAVLRHAVAVVQIAATQPRENYTPMPPGSAALIPPVFTGASERSRVGMCISLPVNRFTSKNNSQKRNLFTHFAWDLHEKQIFQLKINLHSPGTKNKHM